MTTKRLISTDNRWIAPHLLCNLIHTGIPRPGPTQGREMRRNHHSYIYQDEYGSGGKARVGTTLITRVLRNGVPGNQLQDRGRTHNSHSAQPEDQVMWCERT